VLGSAAESLLAVGLAASGAVSPSELADADAPRGEAACKVTKSEFLRS
jgi:hypothetical protein